MKIIDVRIHKVVVPMRPGAVHSAGVEDKLCAPDPVTGRALNFWEFPKWIIELVADNGLVGLGEPRRGDLYGPLRDYAERIIGKTLQELPVGNLPLPHGDDYESYIIYEAYEMAWLDLLGKHLRVPVHHLLGGAKIDRVPIDFWMGRGTPEDTAQRAQLGLELGFHGLKMKCELGDPIAERVAAVRAVAPDFSIVLDPNERFVDLDGTRAVARSLEKFDRVIFESPVPQHRLDWYVELRGVIPQSIALHLTSLADLLPALRAEAADYYNLLGPLKEFVDWATLTRSAGCPTWRGTGMDLGVRDMSSVHAAAAAGCELPSDIIGHLLREDDLLVESMAFVDGNLLVPDAPGLGVELDRVALEQYRVPLEESELAIGGATRSASVGGATVGVESRSADTAEAVIGVEPQSPGVVEGDLGSGNGALRAAYLCCYPWDFADEGLDELIGRARDLGITHLAVASIYHAGFFFYPHNPRRKVHLLEDGVAYFHPDDSHYRGGPLHPTRAALCRQRDWFGDICQAAQTAGLKLCAWTVVLHNTRLGLEYPQCTVQNVFGDSYPHALSPADPDAVVFARGLVRDLASHYPLDSIMLEAPNYRSRAHGGSWVGGHHHERQGTHLRTLENYLLDLSFNPADVEQAAAAGVDMDALRLAVRTHLERYLAAAPEVPVEWSATIEQFRADHPELAGFEAHRRRVEAELLRQLKAEVEPHGVRLLGGADPSMDLVMAGVYGEPVERVAALTRAAKAGLGEGQQLVSVLRMGFYGQPEFGTPIVSEAQMVAQVQAVADGGADAVGFYNYAEAPSRCVDWIKPALQSVGIAGHLLQ